MSIAIDVDSRDDDFLVATPPIGEPVPLEKDSAPSFEEIEEMEEDPAIALARGWRQIAYIVAGIGSAVLLSAAGVLPNSVMLVAAVGVLSTAVSIAVSVILNVRSAHGEDRAEPGLQRSEFSHLLGKIKEGYEKTLREMEPVDIAVKGPIIEEILFRGILQGGLQWGLKRLLPSAAISLLGLQLPAASVIAAIVAGSLFGLAHLTNNHEGALFQAVNSGISGILVEGTLFAVYGLWASCLVHIINNTIVTILVQLEKSRALSDSLTAGKELQYKDILAAAV